MTEERRARIPADADPDRLDRWLPRLAEVSRGEARRLIDAGGVYVDGRRVRTQSRTVGPGAELRWLPGAHRVAERAQEGPKPSIVHRDRHLLVLDKPAGVPSHATRSTVRGTVERWAADLDGVSYVALHHRLDRDARGLLAVAIHRAANKGLARAFGERLAARRYRALVEGEVEDDEGVWHHALQERGRQRRAVPWRGRGKEMLADWRVVGRREGRTLLEVSLRTGRTHQIRLQAKAAGHPLVGDRLYGSGGDVLHLQAFGLALPHPVTGEALSFELPAPEGW